MIMDNLENNLEVPIGTLFDSINYYKTEDLEKFLSELNHEQALYCLIQACQSAYKRNTYSLLESELLSKAIRKISTPEYVTSEEE
jgi:hypothetical protein